MTRLNQKIVMIAVIAMSFLFVSNPAHSQRKQRIMIGYVTKEKGRTTINNADGTKRNDRGYYIYSSCESYDRAAKRKVREKLKRAGKANSLRNEYAHAVVGYRGDDYVFIMDSRMGLLGIGIGENKEEARKRAFKHLKGRISQKYREDLEPYSSREYKTVLSKSFDLGNCN